METAVGLPEWSQKKSDRNLFTLHVCSVQEDKNFCGEVSAYLQDITCTDIFMKASKVASKKV